MDGDRFDKIARSMASSTSRRRLLKGLGVGAAGLAGVRGTDTTAAPKLVRMCVAGRGKTYTEKLISPYLVPLYKFLGLGFIPAPGANCKQSCVPQSQAVTCGPTATHPQPRCTRLANNCGVLTDCGACAAGHYCDDAGYCQDGCASDDDCSSLADICNAATCVHHQCVQTPINELMKCDEPRSVCWEGWSCKKGVCTELIPIVTGPCGLCMKCDGNGTCIQVPDGFDPWDDCSGMQYCKNGACVGCRDDSACPEGEYCRNGDCFGGCSTDDQCAAFAEPCNTVACVENQCVLEPILDAPVEPGIPCVNAYLGYSGYCQAGECWPCLINEHCPADQFCMSNHFCYPGCRGDIDCASFGGECKAGVCNDGECLSLPLIDGSDCLGGSCQGGTCSDGSATPIAASNVLT